MTERKEGFWWVRLSDHAGWCSAWCGPRLVHVPHPWGPDAEHGAVAEWGLYLGESPDEMLELLLGKDELRRRRLAKAVDPKGDCLR